MKDFRLDRKSNSKYILNVQESSTNIVSPEGQKLGTEDSLTITFADGRKFRNIEFSEENLKKIADQQEKQAKKGVENIGVFERRKTKAGIMTGASIVGGPVIGAVAAAATALNPATIAIGAGVITLGALVPSLVSLISNAGKVKELKKIEYRDKHRTDLSKYSEYENALAGLPARKRAYFETMAEEKNDPFSITEIDSYSIGDLHQIIGNIATEKQYQFTYKK